MIRSAYLYISVLVLFLIIIIINPSSAVAGIKFKEVSALAGIHHSARSTGASWGDFNKDGWPDLWVGNLSLAPSLYLNQRDGTFVDIAAEVLSIPSDVDMLGSAWGDFDNDGDQDLMVMVGGQYGKGVGPNLLLLNEDGVFRNIAPTVGLDLPFGRGRTPMWVDADKDGRLDIVLMNASREDGKAPSTLFRQDSHIFRPANEHFKVLHLQRSPLSKLGDILHRILHLRSHPPDRINSHVRFAQLADFSGDRDLELITYMPMRIYKMDRVPFKEITTDFKLPYTRAVWDVAIEDFDGDLKMDLYITRSRTTSDLIQTSPYEIRGKLWSTAPKDLHFRADGEVNFLFHPWTITPADIIIGAGGYHPEVRKKFTLSPQDPRVIGEGFAATETGKVLIEYNRSERLWNLRSLTKELNFAISSNKPIEILGTEGFEPALGELEDILLLRGDKTFKTRSLDGEAGAANASTSVAAADFDNDMDIDLYLVCRGPARNVPNILLENIGGGHFVVVPDAGGASGSILGRGDSVVTADFDRDGFMDLFVTNGIGSAIFGDEGPHQLFRNEGNSNHWIEIDLEGVLSNRDGIGATILLEAGGVSQIREQRGGMHYTAQNHQRIHFGLGTHRKVDQLTIWWPSGIIQRLENLEADQYIRIREPHEPASNTN